MKPTLQKLSSLLDRIRAAHKADGDELWRAIEESTNQLASDPEYRAALRDEISVAMGSAPPTHPLTELSIVSAEPLTTGVLRRIGSILAPTPAQSAGLEAALGSLLVRSDAAIVARLKAADLELWTNALLDGERGWYDRGQFASAMVILATRVAGAGVEPQLSERMPQLEAWDSPFIQLSRSMDRFAEAHVGDGVPDALALEARDAIRSCVEQITHFRAQKEQLGTTLHLSSASLRMLQQLKRLDLLVGCTLPERRSRSVAALGLAAAEEVTRPHPIRHFVGEKLGLLAYLAIGHAAQKGDKYAVRTPKDYFGFWKKSLFGGVLVAIFASLKLHLSHEALAPVPQAVVYGLNYAICFVFIYVLGATLATKQPALTASRIADALEEGPEHESFPELVRSIWQSQFASLIGNVVGAAGFALLIGLAFAKMTGEGLVSHDEALTLAKKLNPLSSASVCYAAIAGVMLSLAGFFSGFVDNAVVFHKLGERVAAGGGVFRFVPAGPRRSLSVRIEKHAGGISGNVLLGFMLGSAGAIGLMLGLPFDIRHIAFGASHGATAILFAPELLSLTGVLSVFGSVAVIGCVNFIVSFGITLLVAIDARSLDGIDWRSALRAVVRLALSRPLAFFIPLDRSST